jgi:peptidoglycan/LPS O-acetylase OafA/YrhL
MALAVAQVAHAEGRGGRWRTLADLCRAPMACWSIAAAIFAIATTPLAGPPPLEDAPTLFEASAKNLLYCAFAVFLLLPAIFPPAEGRLTVRVLASRPVGYLGSISYGIFLWHVVALDLIRHHWDIEMFTGDWTLFPITFVAACLAAMVSYHAVEEPIQRLSRRATRRRHTSPRVLLERPAPEAV